MFIQKIDKFILKVNLKVAAIDCSKDQDCEKIAIANSNFQTLHA